MSVAQPGPRQIGMERCERVTCFYCYYRFQYTLRKTDGKAWHLPALIQLPCEHVQPLGSLFNYRAHVSGELSSPTVQARLQQRSIPDIKFCFYLFLQLALLAQSSPVQTTKYLNIPVLSVPPVHLPDQKGSKTFINSNQRTHQPPPHPTWVSTV